MAGVLVHCPCLKDVDTSRAPPSRPPLSSYVHHQLGALLFCEECDAVRCDSCAVAEPACFFCPSCLFEVPSASVRAERNRCARNCFQCPQCDSSLSITAHEQQQSASSSSAVEQAPEYTLTCSFCRWDSRQVGIVFPKPTGLAAQLQKMDEPNAADVQELEHLKEHFEPFLRRNTTASQASGSASAAATSATPSAAHAAASASLLRDIPRLGGGGGGGTVSRFGSTFGHTNAPSRRGQATSERAPAPKDEIAPYEALHPAAGAGESIDDAGGELSRVSMMRQLQSAAEIAPLHEGGGGARASSSWAPATAAWKAAEARPQRTPLQVKRSKRCPACRHILIKPEQKATSTRFKIKLAAANYLPAVELHRRAPPVTASRLSAVGTAARLRAGASDSSAAPADEPLRPGRSYSYELTFTNPLYEDIHVRAAVARPSPPPPPSSAQKEEQPGPPYAVHLPSPSFKIGAFAEAWELEDDDLDEAGADDTDVMASPSKSSRRAASRAGIVERRGNRTTVLMEVAVARDALGPLYANMLVTYTYKSDTSITGRSEGEKAAPADDELKSFSFWTHFTLGTVAPRRTAAT